MKADTVARIIASAFLNGMLEERELRKRALEVSAGRRWILSLATRVLKEFGVGKRPNKLRLIKFISRDKGYRRAKQREGFRIHEMAEAEPAMRPALGPPQTWPVLPICTVGELAALLNLSPAELNWFANGWAQQRKVREERFRHYRYLWKRKADGNVRLVEAPKQRLKSIQRFLLEKIINQIPPHAAAHGFVHGRSICSFAAGHTGKAVVLKLDLKNFFPGIRKGLVEAVFRTAGYPDAVARSLAGICTNTTPNDVLNQSGLAKASERYHLRATYKSPHLPQGAPTSPGLANLCAYRLDTRLTGLATTAGAQYTRYADDLLFSGDENFARGIDRFYIQACAVILEEGFEPNTRKTRIMRRGVSQRAAGIVLNSHLNISRRQYDHLKAILHNCVRHGPDAENRQEHPDFQAHLKGRIAHMFMINPAKGEKLKKQFESIQWPQPSLII